MAWMWWKSKPDWSRYSSQQLLTEYLSRREPALLSVLFERYGDALYRFLLRSADAELAADISQQCWLRVMELGEQFAGHSQFKTWLFSIGRHLLLDEFRRRHGKDLLLPEELVDQQAGPDWICADARQTESLQQAIAQLPAEQREALLLQLEEFSLAEIAQICRTSEETVKSRLRYARDKLKQQLGGWHVGS